MIIHPSKSASVFNEKSVKHFAKRVNFEAANHRTKPVALIFQDHCLIFHELCYYKKLSAVIASLKND